MMGITNGCQPQLDNTHVTLVERGDAMGRLSLTGRTALHRR